MPVKEVATHIEKREGNLNLIYKDTEDIATAGIGHNLEANNEINVAENIVTIGTDEYKIAYWDDFETEKHGKKRVAYGADNKPIRIPNSVIEGWYLEDSKDARARSTAQVKDLGIQDPDFFDALVSVNFQFPAWHEEMENAYKALKGEDKKWLTAIENLEWVDPKNPEKGNSKWWNQSRNRVQDFQKAIRKLAAKDDTAVLMEQWVRDDNVFA